MPWPSSVDYNAAIQNLRLNAGERTGLRHCEVARNQLRLPLRWVGNFAAVYKVHCPQTNRTYAVKCFTRHVPHRQLRYREIAKHLEGADLPFTVDFKYLDEGIRVNGVWYPIVKMSWIEGHQLNKFVGDYLNRPVVLRQLLDWWPRGSARRR